jgi:hypothetical protein
MVAVRLIGTKAFNPPSLCRLDTGADDLLVPDFEAGFLGVPLDESRRVPIEALGQGTTAIFETVDLEISGGTDTWRWSASVGFHSGTKYAHLMGQNGFLQHFTASFDGLAHRVTLIPNGSVPPVCSAIP